MKKFRGLLVILSVFFLVVSCSNPEAEKKEDVKVDLVKEKLVISQLLDDLAGASEKGNFEIIESIWWPSEDALLIGTETGEKLEGWGEISEAIKKQFGTFAETLIAITDQDIWVNEDATFAWFYEELNYNFIYEERAMVFQGIRFTGVMKKIDGKWRLMQQHLSIPAVLEMQKTK